MASQLQGKEKSMYVQDMFGRIAKRYNIMNRLMSLGQDQFWRRFVISQAQIPNQGAVLDLATGTGDIAFEALRTIPSAVVVGADFSLPMMYVGKRTLIGQHVRWCGADALHLPFPSTRFDAVTSGYLLRNVPNIQQALHEQMRVLKPGGRMVTLDTSPPPPNLLKPFILFYLRYGIPLLGRLIEDDRGRMRTDIYQSLLRLSKIRTN